MLKRGNKQIETKNTYKYEHPERKNIEINDEMSLISTFAVGEHGTKDKLYKLFLQVYTKTGFKNAAFTDINLLNFVTSDNNDVELEFKKHPFTFLKLKVGISTKFLTEVDLMDNLTDATRLSENG
jgi:hypothetical protein